MTLPVAIRVSSLLFREDAAPACPIQRSSDAAVRRAVPDQEKKLIGHISDRATVNEECVSTWNDLKLTKKYKYIIYKLSDDLKEIVVETTGDNADWEEFREKLINAKTVSKTVR